MPQCHRIYPHTLRNSFPALLLCPYWNWVPPGWFRTEAHRLQAISPLLSHSKASASNVSPGLSFLRYYFMCIDIVPSFMCVNHVCAVPSGARTRQQVIVSCHVGAGSGWSSNPLEEQPSALNHWAISLAPLSSLRWNTRNERGSQWCRLL